VGIGNLLRETGVAFARSCARGSETGVAFAREGSAPTETAISFAGEKWAFWVRFSVAEVMVVSRWSASVVAEVSVVSTSSRHSCLCAKKFALLGPMVGVSAKKFALRAQNGPNSAFYGALGELFRGTVAERTVLGELFRGTVAERSVLGEFFRAYRHGSHVSHVMWRPTCRKWWGFCTTRSPLAACRRRVGASCSAIPPSGGRGGVRTCRGPGGWTLRLAVLTRRCAAKPYWWHGGQPAQATTSRVNVRIKGRSCPPAEPVSLLGANPRRACPQQSAENCAQKPARPRRRTMIGSKYRPFRAPRIRIVAERPRPR